MIKKLVLPVLLLAMCAVMLTAQESAVQHVLEKIVVNIDGNTREEAVLRFIGLSDGMVFDSEEELLATVERKKQVLINYRVFRDIQMETEKLEIRENEPDVRYWRVTYRLTDSWTIVPVPYPKYDTETGFRLGLKTFYANAFGTMTDAYLGLNMDFGPDDSGNWKITQWSVAPAWSKIKIGALSFSVNYLQQYQQVRYKAPSVADSYHYAQHQSNISIGSSVNIFDNLSYSFRPSFVMKYGYSDILGNGNYREETFNFSWNHSFGWSQVDWNGNYRDGFSTSLGHSIRLVYNPTTFKTDVVNDLTLSGAFYKSFGRYLNYYVRLQGFATFNGVKNGVASNLRGVANSEMSGSYGLLLNNTLGITFWRWEGVWDAQVHPFFDVGIVAPEEGGFDASRAIRYSTGADFVLYLDALPNLVARGTFGIDLSKHAWTSWDKYYITISSALRY